MIGLSNLARTVGVHVAVRMGCHNGTACELAKGHIGCYVHELVVVSAVSSLWDFPVVVNRLNLVIVVIAVVRHLQIHGHYVALQQVVRPGDICVHSGMG